MSPITLNFSRNLWSVLFFVLGSSVRLLDWTRCCEHRSSSFHRLQQQRLLLSYCEVNTVLAFTLSTLQPLSSVLHTAAHLINDLGPRDHKQQLHCPRITSKISILNSPHTQSGTFPSYMASNGNAMVCFEFYRTSIVHTRRIYCTSY